MGRSGAGPGRGRQRARRRRIRRLAMEEQRAAEIEESRWRGEHR
ncbi:hypothetical protein OOK41_12085 [Micromonospora sp. NBC_01655]|nr:hypothetical protein [Micromonospora sp. NBC_01655]MCX4471041.1 hypothetical protein [Micromonospora sp. NBC_01655]